MFASPVFVFGTISYAIKAYIVVFSFSESPVFFYFRPKAIENRP